MTLHSRDEWAQGRMAVDGQHSRALADITEFVVVDWSQGRRFGDPDPAVWLRNLHDWYVHEDPRLYADIPFSYAVDETGGIWECRPIHLWSAAAYGHNEEAVSCLVLWPPDQVTETAAAKRAVDKCYELVQQAVHNASGGKVERIDLMDAPD